MIRPLHRSGKQSVRGYDYDKQADRRSMSWYCSGILHAGPTQNRHLKIPHAPAWIENLNSAFWAIFSPAEIVLKVVAATRALDAQSTNGYTPAHIITPKEAEGKTTYIRIVRQAKPVELG